MAVAWSQTLAQQLVPLTKTSLANWLCQDRLLWICTKIITKDEIIIWQVFSDSAMNPFQPINTCLTLTGYLWFTSWCMFKYIGRSSQQKMWMPYYSEVCNGNTQISKGQVLNNSRYYIDWSHPVWSNEMDFVATCSKCSIFHPWQFLKFFPQVVDKKIKISHTRSTFLHPSFLNKQWQS